MGILGKINKKYVEVSNRVTRKYEDVYYFLCDLYFPINQPNPSEKGTYNAVNIFEPHQQAEYNDMPDVSKVQFVIPHLLRKQSMNSPEDEFDSFYLEEDSDERPFIETSKENELPILTKVVVYVEQSKMYFFVDKKLVVNGADGHMLLRQYLSPLAEG